MRRRLFSWAASPHGMLWLAGVAFVLLLGLPRLFMPLATDQAYFALGARTILEGDQLYRDFWDIKPPLIYLLYTLPAAVLGEFAEAYRLLDVVNTVVAMVAVSALSRRFLSPRAAYIAAVMYGFSYLTTAGMEGFGQTESFMVAPLAFALALYPGPEANNSRRALIAGLLLGVAVALKFSGATFFFGFVALEWALRDSNSADWRPALRRLSIAAAGVLLAQAPWVLYLLATGVLGDFIEIQRSYTLPYTDLRWAPEHFSYVRFLIQAATDWFRNNAYVTVPAWLGLALLLLRAEFRTSVFFVVLVACGLLSVWWQGKLFVYHWLVMLPLMAPLVGHAVDRFLEYVESIERPRRLALVTLAAVGFFGIASASWFSTYDSYRYLFAYLSGSSSRQELQYEYLAQLRENRELVEYVKAHSTEEEGLYVWGFWTAPYLWSDQAVPTRFLTNAALRATWSPAEWRAELVGDLTSDPPRFFAIAQGDIQPWLVGSKETSATHFCYGYPALRQFVESHYQPVFRNELYVVYDRQATQGEVATWCEAPYTEAPPDT